MHAITCKRAHARWRCFYLSLLTKRVHASNLFDVHPAVVHKYAEHPTLIRLCIDTAQPASNPNINTHSPAAMRSQNKQNAHTRHRIRQQKERLCASFYLSDASAKAEVMRIAAGDGTKMLTLLQHKLQFINHTRSHTHRRIDGTARHVRHKGADFWRWRLWLPFAVVVFFFLLWG